MPADAVNYGKLAEELNAALSDGRIDKIVMSDKTTLALSVRARGKNNTLLITAATSPRCFLTAFRPKGTEVPLSFCLHLRRHIGGGCISRIFALPFERILGIGIVSHGDLGEPTKYTLYVEIMGKYSTVVLTDGNGRITDALKHVGFEESRPVMPGLTFVPPRDETRFDPTSDSADALAAGCPKSVTNTGADITPVTYTYTSSNPSAAAVDDNGVVTFVGNGTTTITIEASNGVTFTLEEVCFTKTELAELREQLLKEGAPEDALANFDLLAGRPDGATLGQVLASLQLNGKPSLTDDDISSLTGLLNQLDPSGTLTDQTLDLMRNGHSQQALIGINQALMQLDATSEITLSQGDLQTLGKALNLPESVLGKMKSLFGSADELTLNKEQMSALLAPAQDYLGQLALKQQKLDDAAEATVKRVIGKARERMKKEREAESLQSREVEQSKTMIKETVQENSHGTLTEALQQSGDAKLNEALSKNAQGTDLPDGFEHIGKQGQGDPQQFAGGNQDGKGRNTPDGGKNDAWSSLLTKVKADTGSGLTSNAYRTDGVMGTAFATLHQLAGQQQMPNSARAEVGPYLSQQAAQQVQNGLLSALRNGGTRLDLQLNPVELGSIAITLSSRNGEVTAQIRTEKTETMQAMQQQAEAIRLQLEQQGVKIDKIEVQLQNQGNNQQADSGWQNMQQHNTWAEQDARREELSRLRNLAMVRNSAGNKENTGLAHSMQDTEQTAIYATRRLNVVA